MKFLPRAAIVAVMAVLAAAVMMMPTQDAEAQKQYKNAFDKKFKGSLKKTDCGICHPKGGKDKKHRNDFGQAVETALGEKEVEDEDKILKALETASEKPSKKNKEKTFGEMIKAGKRPE